MLPSIHENTGKPKKITRGTMELIQLAIQETGSKNRFVLCQFICSQLENKHADKNLEYQTKRMNLDTTGKILRAIDEYFYKHYKKENTLSKEK